MCRKHTSLDSLHNNCLRFFLSCVLRVNAEVLFVCRRNIIEVGKTTSLLPLKLRVTWKCCCKTFRIVYAQNKMHIWVIKTVKHPNECFFFIFLALFFPCSWIFSHMTWVLLLFNLCFVNQLFTVQYHWVCWFVCEFHLFLQ